MAFVLLTSSVIAQGSATREPLVEVLPLKNPLSCVGNVHEEEDDSSARAMESGREEMERTGSALERGESVTAVRAASVKKPGKEGKEGGVVASRGRRRTVRCIAVRRTVICQSVAIICHHVRVGQQGRGGGVGPPQIYQALPRQ